MQAVARERVRRLPAIAALFLALCLVGAISAPSANADEKDWAPVAEQMEEILSGIPDQYAADDVTAIETSIRQAYYEVYQVSGLESEIDHRLGSEQAEDFYAQLLALRDLARGGASQEEVTNAVDDVMFQLQGDVAELADAPEVTDKWTRVADRAIESLETAKSAYAEGDFQGAANGARDAYLAHYEADGLEKASISYLGQARVSELESMFTQLRQLGRDGDVSVDEYNTIANTLIQALQDDAAELDQLTSSSELGWAGFWASFLILLREGAEAMLVVAALVTYAKKAGRKDQLAGILIGVGAAILLAIGIAFAFSRLTASVASGFGQELIEGITGILAVIMLIWASNWILSKASGKRWDAYIKKQAGEQVKGGTFALASVAFLAVLREGAETILFFSPILAASKTSTDNAKIWLGVGAAVLILAVIFLLVWAFGVRLPMQAFFKWTSVLLGVLAITIAGGAIKEFQDATLIPVTVVEGAPTISFLGLYPTVETLVAQLIVIGVLVALAIVQFRASRKAELEPGDDEPTHEETPTETTDMSTTHSEHDPNPVAH
ncbi:FTR1 family protein [Actinomycetaceae bacterium MB13-C1-2]|nr:FTR1 family protein [Actinomycetaceae bacterium MB13-C1-2]